MLLYIALANSHYNGNEWKPTRKLLRRRSLWMVVIGLLHGALLYVGDIIAAYGVLSFLLVRALRWRTRTLVILAAVVFAVLTALTGPFGGSLSVETADGPDPAMLPETLWSAVVDRGIVLPILAPLEALGLCVPFLIGIIAARYRILETPERHLKLLRWTAVVGIGAAIAGGLPVGLTIAGVIDQPSEQALSLWGTVHDDVGYLGGLGYAAAIALLAVRIGDRRGPVTRAIAAVGQRSMTCYLTQSLVWTVVFAPYVLDLSDNLTVASVAAIAIGTWLLTVVVADLMRRHNRRGPFETLLRRLTYRTRNTT